MSDLEPASTLAELIGEVTDDEARQILSRFNASHFNNPGEHARYSIPADPRRDDDLRLAAYIDQTEQLRQRDAAHAERIRELEGRLQELGELLKVAVLYHDEEGYDGMYLQRALALASGNTKKQCRRCSECEGEEHHWIEHFEERPGAEPFCGYICKHCDETVSVCDGCDNAVPVGTSFCAECSENKEPTDD